MLENLGRQIGDAFLRLGDAFLSVIPAFVVLVGALLVGLVVGVLIRLALNLVFRMARGGDSSPLLRAAGLKPRLRAGGRDFVLGRRPRGARGRRERSGTGRSPERAARTSSRSCPRLLDVRRSSSCSGSVWPRSRAGASSWPPSTPACPGRARARASSTPPSSSSSWPWRSTTSAWPARSSWRRSRSSAGGFVLALALAFGLGARDLAKGYLEKRLRAEEEDSGIHHV